MKHNIQLELLITTMLILGVVALVSYEDQDKRMLNWEVLQRAEAIQRGAELYDLNCASCHGNNGEGVGDLGPALNDETFFVQRLEDVFWTGTLEEYTKNAIATGRIVPTRDYYAGDGQVAMNAWAQEYGGPLRPDEIDDLTAFVLNWQATALGEVELEALQITVAPSAAGDPQEGKRIFLENGCGDCHSIETINAIAGEAPDLTHIASNAATRRVELSTEGYLRESFLIPNAYIVEGYSENSGCGGVLSFPQLEHLIAFLLTLE